MARQPNETRVRTKLGSLTLGVVRKGIKRVSTRRVFLPRRLSSVVFLATRHFPSADNTHPSPRLRAKQAGKILSAIRFIADRKSWSKTVMNLARPEGGGGGTKGRNKKFGRESGNCETGIARGAD